MSEKDKQFNRFQHPGYPDMVIASDDEEADELQLQAELMRLRAVNFQLWQEAQRQELNADLFKQERDRLIRENELLREKYARKCR